MNPLGIAMAFVVLWSMVGLGVFLLATAAVRVAKNEMPFRAVAHAMVVGEARVRTDTMINLILLVVGVTLTFIGGNGIYTVIYR